MAGYTSFAAVHSLVTQVMASSSTALKRTKFVCGHCDQELSKTQFYKHTKTFFDKKRRCWLSEKLPRHSKNAPEEDFDLGSSSEDFDFSDISEISRNSTPMAIDLDCVDSGENYKATLNWIIVSRPFYTPDQRRV